MHFYAFGSLPVPCKQESVPIMSKRKAADKLNFTKKQIQSLKPRDGDYMVYDSKQPGLALRVWPTGKKVFVWQSKIAGRKKKKTIGQFPSVVVEEARREAEKHNVKAREKEQAIKNGEKREKRILIQDAFDRTFASSKKGERAKRDWHYQVKRFMTWLGKAYPKIRYWNNLDREILEEFMETFADKAPNTRRLRVQPIVQTSRRMHTLYGTPRFADDLRIGNAPVNPPARVFMKDVLAFLDYVREQEPRLEAGATLQALAGLRATEAIRLSWDRVDLENGWIEISGETKNKWSERVIPVCQRVLDTLKRAKAEQASEKIQEATDGYVVRSEYGKPYAGSASWHNYGKEITALIRAWHDAKAKEAQKNPPPISWTCKDLRNCLPTLAMQKRLSGAAVWEAYLGHSPQGVTERHYLPRLTLPTEGEREALQEEMDILKSLVVDVIDNAVQGLGQGSQNSKVMNIPGHL